MQKAIRRAKDNQKGFTLVELMVVVIIIGILVAIAIPVYGAVQRNAQNGAHQANVRILKGAAQMLIAEYGLSACSDPANNPYDGTTAYQAGTLSKGSLRGYVETWPIPPRQGSGGETAYTVTISSNGTVNVSPANLGN